MNGSRPPSIDDGTPSVHAVSRRTVLRGLAAAAVIPTILMQTERRARAQPARLPSTGLGATAGSALAPSSLHPRMDHTAVAMSDGSVLVAGGYSRAPLADVQIYRGGQWIAAAPMLRPRYQHAAVAMGDGRVYVLGGLHQGPLADVEVYDPQSDTWARLAPMLMPRHQHAAVDLGGSILITGGSYIGVLDRPEIYTPAGW